LFTRKHISHIVLQITHNIDNSFMK